MGRAGDCPPQCAGTGAHCACGDAGGGWDAAGQTTAAAPPPRRVGSAAACSWPFGRTSMPVAAPISGVEVKSCPNRVCRSFPYCEMNAGSATFVGCVPLRGARCRNRVGERHAEVEPVEQDLQHGRDDRRAPCVPTRQRSAAVVEHDRRRHARARALATSGQIRIGHAGRRGTESKSVSSLLSRNPWPRTMIALPPICSIVLVYATTLPCGR